MTMARRLPLAGSLILALLASGGGIAPAAEAVHRVVMKSVDYDPKEVRAHVGDVVEWENQDIVAHTSTAADRSWNINILPGRRGRTVLQAAGTFGYVCRYHPNMTGEIIVEP
jgi:plastocyanin